MAQIKHIVLAYDDSEGSKKALLLAKEMISNFQGAKLFVAHVYEEKTKNIRMEPGEAAPESVPIQTFVADGSQVAPLAQPQDTIYQSDHAIIDNSSERALSNVKADLESSNVNADFTILEGNPGDAISEFAKEVNADLIIIGQSGKGGIKRKLLGGVSQKTAAHAPCHVLIAK